MKKIHYVKVGEIEYIIVDDELYRKENNDWMLESRLLLSMMPKRYNPNAIVLKNGRIDSKKMDITLRSFISQNCTMEYILEGLYLYLESSHDNLSKEDYKTVKKDITKIIKDLKSISK